jgi:hypothetical protein
MTERMIRYARYYRNGTTFNLPNFVGELFELTPADTPFLSAIGGLTGGNRPPPPSSMADL